VLPDLHEKSLGSCNFLPTFLPSDTLNEEDPLELSGSYYGNWKTRMAGLQFSKGCMMINSFFGHNTLVWQTHRQTDRQTIMSPQQ